MANPSIIDPSSGSPIAVHTNQPLRMVATGATNWYYRFNGGGWTAINSTTVPSVVWTTPATVTYFQTFDVVDIAVVPSGAPSTASITLNLCNGPVAGVNVTSNIRNEALQDPPSHSDMLENDDPPLGFPLGMPGANRDGFGTVLLERAYEFGGPANLVSLYGPGLFLDSAGELGSRTWIGKNRGLGVVPQIASYHYGSFYFVYDFGQSRTLSLTRHLFEDNQKPPNVAVVRGDGRRNMYRYFNFNSGFTYYTSAALVKNTLLKAGSFFREITPSGTYYVYNVGSTGVGGKPVLVLDRYNNTIYYNYNVNNKLQKVTGLSGAQGLVPYLDYDSSGRCNLLVLQDYTTPANNRTMYMMYDSNNNLIEITGPELCTAYFAYDSLRNLLQSQDSENNTWKIYYDYNSTKARATAIVDGLGQAAYFAYDTTTPITTWKDRAAKATYFQYNAYGSPITVWNVGTTADYYQYEAYYLTQATDQTQSGFLVSAKNRLGNAWYYQYDASGNRISSNDPFAARSYFGYNSTNFELQSYTDPLGRKTYMAYDTQRNLTLKIDPVLNTTYWKYQTLGLLFFKQDRRGGFTYYVFDAAADLTAVKDPLAFTTYYNYSSAGDRNVSVDPLNRVSYMNYDRRSRVVATFDPLFDSNYFAYDAACNLITQVDPRSNTTYHVYDGNYNRLQTTNAIGAATYFTYDPEDRLASRKDANLNKTSFSYDVLGRRQNQTDPFSNVRYWAYDAAHENNMVLDEDSDPSYFDYDLAGRPAHQKDAFLNQVYFGYDLRGNRILTIDKRGYSAYLTYDKRDVVQNSTNAIGAVTYNAYDPELNRIMVLDPLSQPAYWNYDLRNLVTNTRDAFGNYTYMLDHGARELTTRLAQPQNTTTIVFAPVYYDYDLAGRQAHMKDAFLNQTYTAYDPSSNVVLTLNQRQATNGFVYSYMNYDQVNRLIESRDTGQLRTYFYFDLVGNRTQVDQEQGWGRQPWGTSPYGGERVSTYMTYDALNRQSQALSAMSVYSQTIALTYMGYDKASNRIFMEVDNPQGGSDKRCSYWIYDSLNRVTKAIDPPSVTGGTPGFTYFLYDANSNRTMVVDQEGAAYLTFDQINRQQNVLDAFLDTTYMVYDLRNSMTRKIDPVGRATYMDYDSLGRVQHQSNALGQVSYFGYDPRSERILVNNPRNFSSYMTYDLLGRLSTTKDALNGVAYYGYDEVGNQVLRLDQLNNPTYWTFDQANRVRVTTDALQAQTYMGYDAAGSVRQKLDADGRLIYAGYFGFDASRRQATKMFSVPTGVADPWEYFTYDSVGNLTQTQDDTGTSNMSYDDLNRLTVKAIALSGPVYCLYDKAGLKTGLLDPNRKLTYYVYDAASRLQKAQFDSLRTVYYQYDASALEIAKALPSNSVLTYSTYDVASRLKTLNNVSSSFGVINYFFYGRDANGSITSTTRESGNAFGQNVYYTFDALDRLTLEEFRTGATLYYGFQYNYDAASNRYFKHDEVNNTTAYYAFDARNLLTQEKDLP